MSTAMQIENSVRKNVGSAQPVQELHGHWLIESVGGAKLRDVGGSRLFAEHHRGRITGRQARDEEHQRGHDEHHDHHAGEPRREISNHGMGPLLALDLPELREALFIPVLDPSRKPRASGPFARAPWHYFCKPVFQKNGHGIGT